MKRSRQKKKSEALGPPENQGDKPSQALPGKPSKTVIKVSQTCGLLGVNVVECSGRVGVVQVGDQIQDLDLQMKFGVGRPPEAQHFLAAVGLELTCRAKADPARVLATMSCQIALRYLVPDPVLFGSLSDQDLGEFAIHIGSRHGWPYLRQFCQDLAQRMMLPTLLLPPLAATLLRSAQAKPGS